MYTLAVKRDFIAQHFLVGGDWGEENENHAHQYKTENLEHVTHGIPDEMAHKRVCRWQPVKQETTSKGNYGSEYDGYHREQVNNSATFFTQKIIYDRNHTGHYDNPYFRSS